MFTLFTGFGLGSLLFAELLRFGFGWSLSLAMFGALQLLTGLLAVPLFWREVPDPTTAATMEPAS